MYFDVSFVLIFNSGGKNCLYKVYRHKLTLIRMGSSLCILCIYAEFTLARVIHHRQIA